MERLFCWGEEWISARAVRDAALLEERWISDRSGGTGMCWRRSGSQIEPLELGLLEEKWGPDRAVVPAVWGEETWILGRGVRAVVSLKEKWISGTWRGFYPKKEEYVFGLAVPKATQLMEGLKQGSK